MIHLQNAAFILSAARPDQFIQDPRPKIVFAGRSNVGKSSVLNCLLQRRNFARVGQSPGKTVHVNYFLIDEQAYLVDLPGYGYAKVSRTEKERWGRLMEAFFANPMLLNHGVLIVDSRHKPTRDDVTMCAYFQGTGCPLTVVANKTDKLKKSEIAPNLALIRETLALDANTPLIPFSAEKRTGREELLAALPGLQQA